MGVRVESMSASFRGSQGLGSSASDVQVTTTPCTYRRWSVPFGEQSNTVSWSDSLGKIIWGLWGTWVEPECFERKGGLGYLSRASPRPLFPAFQSQGTIAVS